MDRSTRTASGADRGSGRGTGQAPGSAAGTLVGTFDWVRLQVGAWLALTAIYFALDLAAQPEPRALELAVRALVWGLCGWVLSVLAWRLWQRWGWGDSPASLVTATGLGGLSFGLLWLSLFTGIDYLVALEPGFVPIQEWEAERLLSEGLTFVFPMLAWHGVAFSLDQAERRANARARATEAEGLLERARLDALRYQLNPHLLFNALNSVMAMIDEDPARAEGMLGSLSLLMRGTLDAPREGTLGEELERVQAYLELEQIRFEARLEVALDVDEHTLALPLPTLLVQPLVENAIKHGMGGPAPLRVRVASSLDAGMLRVGVENSGTLASPGEGGGLEPAGLGVGVANIRARLAAHYGEGARLVLVEEARSDGPWVVARLELPTQMSGEGS